MIEYIYIWLDIEGNIRNKSRYMSSALLQRLPNWSFDGSSTGQAVTQSSDIILHPVVYRTSNECSKVLVLCEMRNALGEPIKSDYRIKALNCLKASQYENWMFGFEQEFVIFNRETQKPLGWPVVGYPEAQGKYYCSTNYGRHIVDEHAEACIDYKLKYFGNNAEVMPGQWEYQIGPTDDKDFHFGIRYCDDLIFSRFLLESIADSEDCSINYNPKPVSGDWNGSGLHTNFSNSRIREEDSKAVQHALGYMERTHKGYIENICGKGWETRLTGQLETSDPRKFTVGDGNRECSVRIPPSGTYLEDRRPCANANPYKIVAGIVI